MDTEELLKHAKNPEYIPGVYNYCDRWCERCELTARCMNCTLVKEQFGDLEEIDRSNAVFWEKLSGIFQSTLDMLKKMAEDEGIDLDAVDAEDVNDTFETVTEDVATDIFAHVSKKYAKLVDEWFNSNEQPLLEKEEELNRIRLVSSGHDPAEEAVDITDAIEVIRWYQYQIHVKLVRACRSAAEEALGHDDFPKDSDGSAKVALIGIDRSIAAWNTFLIYFPGQKAGIVPLSQLLRNIRIRVENRFPDAKDFVRSGFDENAGVRS